MANSRSTFGSDPIRGSGHSTSYSGHGVNRNDEDDDEDDDLSLANSSNCANLRHGYHNSYNAGKLPLPDDFFPVPQLSSKENKYLLGLAKHACKEVVYYSRQEDGPMKWIHLSSDDGVDVFQGVDKDGSGNAQDTKALTYLRGACKIHATIDEISDFFKLDTPDKLSGFEQSVGKDLLDQKTLLTLATPTPDNPKHYVAVKWTAVESPSKLARNRDFCYIECHDEFIDSNTKRRGWVRSIHSIRLPFCPPLNRSHGLVRGSLYRSGYIFTESSEEGCVDAVHTLHVDIKGNAPNWLKILIMKRRIKNIAEVDRYFRVQRLTQGKLLGDLELPAKERVMRCQICEARFGLFHRRRLCRKCGKVVCTSCGNEFLLDYAGLGPKKVRVCLECSESVGSVPMMNEHVKKLGSREIHPIYDDSLSCSSMVMLETRNQLYDQGYFMENDDENGLPDMEEAKQMDKEFEAGLEKSSAEHVDEQEGSKYVTRVSDKTEASSRETNELPSWKDRRQLGIQDTDDDMEDDDELGLPLSKREQMLQQMREEEKKRCEQTERTNKQYECVPGIEVECRESMECSKLQPRASGIAQNELKNSFRLSSGWGEGGNLKDAVDVATFESSGIGANSDSPVQPCLSGSEFESTYTLLSDSQLGGTSASHRRHQSHDSGSQDDEAFRLAMSAMRLYEEERGPKLQVTEETRQVALTKMMKVYASEIKRSHRNDPGLHRGTISDTRRLHHDVGILPLSRRTLCNDRATPFYDSSMEDFSLDDTIPIQQHRQHISSSRRSREIPCKASRDETCASTLLAQEETHEKMYEYRNLSDLSSSAFQAFQINSLIPKDAPKLPTDAMESCQDSGSSRNGFQQEQEHTQLASAQLPWHSDSTTHTHLKSDTYGNRTGAGRTVLSSLASNEVSTMLSRPNSMYGVGGSDTFSDMDFVDLPHLMRKDDVDIGAPNSFAHRPHWTKDNACGVSNGSVEYTLEPHLNSLLSSLDLEGVQHVDGDDSDSQSSNSSSQIDWQSSLQHDYSGEQRRLGTNSESSTIPAYSITLKTEVEYQCVSESLSDLTNGLSESMVTQDNEQPPNQYGKTSFLSDLLSECCDSERSSLPSKTEAEYQSDSESFSDLTNGLSASMVTQNDEQPLHQYDKTSSRLDLLSEHCGSERSSLPSYVESGRSQPELEPDYLEAIEKVNNLNSIYVEARRQGYAGRQSSMPADVESHELCL